MLKQRLQEKEEELQKKNTMIEVLDAEKVVIQLENQENKKKIQELEEKLQTVKPATSTMSTQTMELPAPVINLSENAKDALFTLLNVRNTLKTENPLQKIQEVASQLSEKSHDKQIQITAKCGEKHSERKTNFYINSVNSHVKWVLAQSDLPSNWDPCLPEFPVYSTKFQAAYKTILKADPPKICETLLKALLEKLEDKECVICSDDMESFERFPNIFDSLLFPSDVILFLDERSNGIERLAFSLNNNCAVTPSTNKIPMMSSSAKAIVKFTYEPRLEDELRLIKGEQVCVFEKGPDGWWKGEAPNGSVGWFPSNFVEMLNRYGIFDIRSSRPRTF
ncbi:hypothetical protein CAEBREN_26000 [Caenorhabditis brenneri]|uniref:SH3 domain-containing protein n=1 Tax=Caenorhabditis brenneri TaxID=135651 RepID=G0P0N1_CAEBE|nr:hypothetical protein CAEBREN_26000 [Caenorhabditis brenneri]